MSELSSITFITWELKDDPNWVMVHPCSVTQWAGVLSFDSPQSNGQLVNAKELNIPVPKRDLSEFLALYVHHTMKVSAEMPTNIQSVGNQGDMRVFYNPKD